MPALALISPAFWIAWIELIYSGEAVLSGSEPTALTITVNYAVSTLAMAGLLIVYGCMPGRMVKVIQNQMVVLGAGLMAGLATLLGAVTGSWLATLCTGVFTSVLAIRFGLLLSQVNPKTAMISIVISQIMASFIYGYGLMLPGQWGLVFLCLLPLIAAFCSLLDGGRLVYETTASSDGVSSGYLRLVLAVFVFSIAINVVRGFYPSMVPMDTFAEARGNSSVLFFFVKMGLACVVLMLPTKTNLAKLSYFGFVVLAFITLPLPVFGLGSGLMLEIFGCVNALLNILIWTLLAGIAYKSGRSPVRLFGWGWGAMAIGSVLGWLIGYLLFAAGVEASTMNVVEISMLGLMLVSCIFVVTWQVVDRLFDPPESDGPLANVDRSLGAERVVGSGEPGAELVSDAGAIGGMTAGATEAQGSEDRPQLGRWKKAVRDMAFDQQLSSRESDVLELLLKGYSKQHIAEDLFIAYNTVRSHVRNIYTKCDVHNQQELIVRFETRYLEGE